MTITLRKYQEEALASIYQYLKTESVNPLAVLPTGSGKTPILATIANDVVNRWHGRVLILAHVKELLEQAAEKLKKINPYLSTGIYSAGLKKKDKDNNVIIAGIQSVYSKACDLGRFDIIIVDEAHLIPPDGDGMYRTFLDDAKKVNPHIRMIGLTATPYRMKTGLIVGDDNIFNKVCYESKITDLIEQGYLSPLRTKDTNNKINCSKIAIKRGEFDAGQVDSTYNTERNIYSSCREIIEKTEDRKSVLIFACSIEHAKNIKNTIEKLTNMECGFISGSTSSEERRMILSRFKREVIKKNLFDDVYEPLKYLVNVNVLTTGFDAQNIDCVVLLRPTLSPGLYYQMVGRGFRIHSDKKDCLVLDYGGNIQRHGPVDAIQVKKKQSYRGDGTNEPITKICPNCQEIVAIACRKCPCCGTEFVFQEPDVPESKLSRKAEEHGILSTEYWDTELDVSYVDYMLHKKKGAKEDDPYTVKVIYHVTNDLFGSVCEWVCPEHTGFARRRFVEWWQARCKDHLPPIKAETVIDSSVKGYILEPKKITVRQKAGDFFKRIIKVEDLSERYTSDLEF